MLKPAKEWKDNKWGTKWHLTKLHVAPVNILAAWKKVLLKGYMYILSDFTKRPFVVVLGFWADEVIEFFLGNSWLIYLCRSQQVRLHLFYCDVKSYMHQMNYIIILQLPSILQSCCEHLIQRIAAKSVQNQVDYWGEIKNPFQKLRLVAQLILD